MKLDEEIAATALMLIRSLGETAEIQTLDNSIKFNQKLAEIWRFDLASITALLQILQLSAARRFLRWDKTRNLIRDNSREVKRLKLGVNASKLFMLPK